MSNYCPDNWVIIKLKYDNDSHYRILAGWSGGYASGDAWRMNSGITKVEEDDRAYHFFGSSGSMYICGKRSYGIRMNNAHIWTQLQEIYKDKVEMMPEDTDWMSIDWHKLENT